MTDPYALNGLVHYTRSGRTVSETHSQAWLNWFDLQRSPDPDNQAMAQKLKAAMDQADEQSRMEMA